MIQKEFSLTLDVKRGVVESPVIVVKGDTGNVLHLRLQDGGADLDLTGAAVVAAFRGAEGAYTETAAEGVSISGAVVTVPVLPMAVSEGTNSCDIQIYTENETLITSAAFTFECRAATAGDDAIEADKTLPVVLALLRRIEEAEDRYPSVQVSTIPGGVRITVTAFDGTVTYEDVYDGKSGVYVGGGDMPEGYNVQIDPDGEAAAFVPEPTNEGTAGQVLATDGAGGRYWKTVSGGGGGTGDYTELENKPQINGTTLVGNKTAAQLGLAAASHAHAQTDVTGLAAALAGKEDILTATGDRTDRTAEIEAQLTAKGVCRLGPGDFYVTGIHMPQQTCLFGDGFRTRIILSGTGTAGAAVYMNTFCSVCDLRIYGESPVITPTASLGNRHGILWKGTVTASGGDPLYLGTVRHVSVFSCTGGGITCEATGPSVIAGLNVSDVILRYCGAGVNIQGRSEYHRFENVSANGCWYGCINKSGNNLFTNCNFSGNEIGLSMEDPDGTLYNDSHGGFVNCSFNHNAFYSSSATKYAAIIEGMSWGELFNGCNFFFGGVDIADSTGIRFTGCSFGTTAPISVSGSNAVSFDGCLIRDTTNNPVTLTGSTVEFNGCHTHDGKPFYPADETKPNKLELLWENPSPTASFAGQTITAASDGWKSGKTYADYDLIVVTFLLYYSASTVSELVTAPVDGKTRTYWGVFAANNISVKRGYVVKTGGVQFTSGYFRNFNGSDIATNVFSENNNACIPQKIYGIRCHVEQSPLAALYMGNPEA